MKKKTSLLLLLILISSALCYATEISFVDITTHRPISQDITLLKEDSKTLQPNSEGKIILDEKVNRIIIIAKGYDTTSTVIGKMDKTVFLFPQYDIQKTDKAAKKIVEKVWTDQNNNLPNKLNSYEFNSYVRFVMDANADSLSYINFPSSKLDTLNNSLKDALKNSALYVGEREMKYTYSKKYGSKNTITHYKAGGLNNPELYSIASTQTRLNKYPEYLNPINTNLVYKFIDTHIIDGRRVYELFLFAKKRRHISINLWIDAETYAVVKMISTKSRFSDAYYEMEWQKEGDAWFTKTEFYKTQMINNKTAPILRKFIPFKHLKRLTQVNSWYTLSNNCYDFQVNTPIPKKSQKKGYDFEMAPSIFNNTSELDSIRLYPLTTRENNTYTHLNELSKKYNFNRKAQFVRSLGYGKLELGPINLNLNKLLSHNLYEGFRFETNLETNYKFSNVFKINGYLAKSTNNTDIKGGTSLSLLINKERNGRITLSEDNDVMPAGRTKTRLLTPKEELESKTQNIYNDKYFKFYKIGLAYDQDLTKKLSFTASLDYQKEKALFNYKYKGDDLETWYNIVNSSLKIRYTPNSIHMMTPEGKITLKESPPYIYASYIKSWNVFDHGNATHQFYVSGSYDIDSKLGNTELILNAGALFGEAPIMNLYEGLGSAKNGVSIWGRSSFRGYQSFETMVPGTFFSDKFVSVFFKQNVNFRLNPKRKIQITFAYNGLLGTMERQDQHKDYNFQVPRHYYQEAGVEFNKLILGIFGVGAYVRMGAYAKDNFDQNLFLKFTADL